MHASRFVRQLFGSAWLAWLVGCQPSAEVPQPPPPEVTVALPVQQEVTDYAEFTGSLQAVNSAELRARVQGFLQEVNFREGEIVEAGRPLFRIEPEPFDAEVQAAKAKLAQAKAEQQLAQAQLARGDLLLPREAISQEDYDEMVAKMAVSEAAILSAAAGLQQAQIAHSYTTVLAPFKGRVGRSLVDPGNVVSPSANAVLTTIEQIDPIHAYFDVAEDVVVQVLRWRKELEENERQGEAKVFLGLIDEQGFPHEGVLDFLDNRVDSGTGTAIVRGRFANPTGVLYPGLFVRLRIPLQPIPDALLVQEAAIGTDLGGKYLLVVDEQQNVDLRHVELGPLFGEQRVIREGITASDRYIVDGLQRARPGFPVTATLAAEGTSPPVPNEPASGEDPAGPASESAG